MKRMLVVLCWFGWGLMLCGCAPKVEEFRGATYSAPEPPPDFSLPSTLGGDFTLSAQTGKVVLLFFGYTYCPDICPAALGTIKTALNQLTPEERADITVAFVTVDPERDSVARLGAYLDGFNAGYVGVVPSLEELDRFRTAYGLVAEKEEVQPDGSYLMAHTALVYALDRAGNLRLGFFSSNTAEDMAHDLRLLLKDGDSSH